MTIAGILRSPTGIGEGARLAAVALAALGYRVGLHDISQRYAPHGMVDPPAGPGLVGHDAGGPLIVHMNPPLMLSVLARMRRQLPGRMIIGYWAWELPVLPQAWLPALRFVHEIWTPSRFVADAVGATGTERTVRVVPHPLAAPRNVAPLDIAPGKILFLTMFAYGSGFIRKNPVAAIHSFRKAFGDRSDVVLAVKSQGPAARHAAAQRALGEAIDAAPNIVVIDRDLTSLERDRLIERADVMVSLHRSEGFGLTLAEALLRGKPVIATDWSGNVDFTRHGGAAPVGYRLMPVDDPLGAYGRMPTLWADPDTDDAAAWMRRLVDPELRRGMGAIARSEAEAYFAEARFADRVRAALGDPQPGNHAGIEPTP